MAEVAASAKQLGATDLSLLPLKPGDHLWRPHPDGSAWHALFVGRYLFSPSDEGAALTTAEGADAQCLPQSVVVVSAAAGAVVRLSLEEFVGSLGAEGTDGVFVRLYTRRPRGRREAVLRALRVVGTKVDAAAATSFPQLLPWWVIFDETEALQPGLCATRARAVRFRLTPCGGDEPVPPALMTAILAGGAVVRHGRVVLRGVRLMKVLRLTKAACMGWANLGSFVGQAIAANILDDGDTTTAVATAAGGWAGSLAGGSAAAVAVSTLGVEGLGAGSMLGGLVVCSSLSAAGAVAGAGLAYAAKKRLDQQQSASGPLRSAEYHDGPLRLIGDANDTFHLFDATLEFPAEDATEDAESDERLTAVGWYAVRVQPGSLGASVSD